MMFTEKMAKYAINGMQGVTYDSLTLDESPMKIHDEVRTIAAGKGVPLDYGPWDTLVTYAMALTCYPLSLDTHQRRCQWVAEYLTDKDGNEDKLFNHFFRLMSSQYSTRHSATGAFILPLAKRYQTGIILY
jgi:hypothetical protein